MTYDEPKLEKVDMYRLTLKVGGTSHVLAAYWDKAEAYDHWRRLARALRESADRGKLVLVLPKPGAR